MMQAEDTSQKDEPPSTINNDVKQAIGRRQRDYGAKRRTNKEETIAQLLTCEARRQVKS